MSRPVARETGRLAPRCARPFAVNGSPWCPRLPDACHDLPPESRPAEVVASGAERGFILVGSRSRGVVTRITPVLPGVTSSPGASVTRLSADPRGSLSSAGCAPSDCHPAGHFGRLLPLLLPACPSCNAWVQRTLPKTRCRGSARLTAVFFAFSCNNLPRVSLSLRCVRACLPRLFRELSETAFSNGMDTSAWMTLPSFLKSHNSPGP